MRRALEENPDRRLFAYGFLDDKYGMLFEDEDTNFSAFQEGKDQASFDTVMQTVRANAAAANSGAA